MKLGFNLAVLVIREPVAPLVHPAAGLDGISGQDESAERSAEKRAATAVRGHPDEVVDRQSTCKPIVTAVFVQCRVIARGKGTKYPAMGTGRREPDARRDRPLHGYPLHRSKSGLMRDPRVDKLAQVLVNYSVAVKRDDVVRIVGSVTAVPLIRSLYREVVIAGGHPVLRILDDECTDIFFEHAGPRQLAYSNPLNVHEIKNVDCSIGIWANDNTRSMTRVPPEKQAAVSKARRRFMDVFMKRAATKGKAKLRWSGTQFPCHSSAQDAEMSLLQYEDFVYGAGLLACKNPAAEWRKVSARQKRVCDVLNRAREVHIKTPQGTDLRFGVKGRRWLNCDGHENFPDGEVFTGPIEDSAEGEVRFSFPAVYRGQEVLDVRLRLKAGKVVEAAASKGEPFLIQMLDQDKGARFVGELALGTNYSIRQFTRNTLFDEKIGGTFHMAVGAGYPETGSRNKSSLHWDMVCDLRQGGVVEADGKVISRNGRFLHSDWPGPAGR